MRAKVENCAPEVQIAPEGKPKAPVINIMYALKASMQKQGQAKVRDEVSKRMGKAAPRSHCPAKRHPPDRGRNAQRTNRAAAIEGEAEAVKRVGALQPL